MAIRDIQAFLRQRAVLFDANLDVNPGSPFDVQVIQPLIRRLGQDPFSVDLATFTTDRITQAFPELATQEGDALTDILVKPATLLWDAIVREILRIKQNLSFSDPASLTLDEADSLGANFFSERRKGRLAKGPGRLNFAQPQNVTVSPVNFVTSRGGLHFFPTEVQSIRTAEMLLNVDTDGTYYFDVNFIAEQAGTEYNIGPNELVSIANVPAAVRVRNLRRFSFGEEEEDAETYVGRLQQELNERSLVTLRGIAAKILNSFPEVNRLNVVGFNDPEMKRDVLKGGGLGDIKSSGLAGISIADGEGAAFTRRFYTTEENFQNLIGADASGWVLTVFGAFGAVIAVKDISVRRVVSANSIDLEDQSLINGSMNLRWTLRKRELTLSDIPGGILFPDTATGTVTVPDDQVHIGGAYDVHVRGSDFEESTLAITSITDDQPLFKGSALTVVNTTGTVTLGEFVLGVDYALGDSTYKTFESAGLLAYTLQILEGPDAGSYRILSVTQASAQPVTLTLSPAPGTAGAPYRWRLLDQLNIDLVEPKETRIEGTDLRTVQGSNIVDTSSGVNFDDFGCAEGDILRILTGPDAGDYTLLVNPLAPSFDKLKIDKALGQSGSNLSYLVFRPNKGGGAARPLVRVKSIELLDSSSQPIGATIPYAKPIDIQSRAFQNPTRGVKQDLFDARLGIVTQDTSSSYAVLAGDTLAVLVGTNTYTLVMPNPSMTPADLSTFLNSQLASLTGDQQATFVIGGKAVGFRPINAILQITGGTARLALFGVDELITSKDVRSATIQSLGGWSVVDPKIDLTTGLDVLQVLDGSNVGFYTAPFTASTQALVPSGRTAGDFLGFAPEVGRHVQVGARSLGSARVFFMEPTSFEVDADTTFTLERDTGDLRFFPDPTLSYQKIPSLPAGAAPKDGVSTASTSIFSSASQDFIKSGIQAGDKLVIERHLIAGDAVLTDPVSGLVNTTFVFSLDSGPDRTLTFLRDDVSLGLTEVSRNGVVTQINAAFGETICSLTGSNTLQFVTTRSLIIRKTGTANALILGNVAGTSGALSFVSADQNNLSPHEGTYAIASVAQTALTITGTFVNPTPFTSPVSNQTFKVLRQGVQRVNTTQMSENAADAGLYYFDVELVSEGTGDDWNIDSDQQLKATGYRSDGYFLTTKDENLTFSTTEDIGLVISRSIQELGVDDDPANATQMSGQSIQITYERASLVGDVQNFIGSEAERVVCSSPLSRHLIPTFVRFDLRYAGGSREDVVVPEIEQLIRDLFPQDALESSDIQKVVLDRGATSIKNPLDLIGIVHYPDRTIYATRSQDSLSTGRLSAFIPDRLDVKRNLS